MDKSIKNLPVIVALAIIISTQSCEKFLDVDPYEGITRGDVYTTNTDQYAIKTGLYSTLKELVEERVILGELRGDLVVAGPGAKHNKSYMEFFNYDITPDNKLLDWS